MAVSGSSFLRSCHAVVDVVRGHTSYIVLSVRIIDLNVPLNVTRAAITRVIVLKGRCFRLEKFLCRTKASVNVVLGSGGDLLAQLAQPERSMSRNLLREERSRLMIRIFLLE